MITSEVDAQDYINGIFTKSHNLANFDGVMGLAESSSYDAQLIATHRVISSNPQPTEMMAWDKFWQDFNKQVPEEDRKKESIWWRRNVEYLTDYDYMTGETNHLIRCRFSIV